MLRKTSNLFKLVAVVFTAAGLLACGNYDPEAQLFREVMIKEESLAVNAPGVERLRQDAQGGNQAQFALSEACQNEDPKTPRCTAEGVAELFNDSTFALVELVQAIIENRPTYREEGRLTWGPVTVESDISVRFEMVRGEDDVFEFCLHMSLQDVPSNAAREMRCSDETFDEFGYARVLFGEIDPQGETLREGAGVLVLDGVALEAFDPDSGIQGVNTFAYDNTSDLRTVSVTIEDRDEETLLLRSGAVYNYSENLDGSGTFRVDVREEVTEGPALERWAIRSQWDAELAGRADYRLSEGDLGDNVFEGTQCWNALFETTYFEDEQMANDPFRNPEGSVEACLFDVPLGD